MDSSEINSNLNAEIARSNQLDNQHTAALNDETTRAKAAEKAMADRLDVIEGDKTVVGSLAHTLEDAKHYTDDELIKAKAAISTEIADGTKDFATKAEVDARIKGVVGTAPEALDTLGEIAEALGKDDDAIKAINGVLTGKANKDEVYTIERANAEHTTLSNAISAVSQSVTNEASRATAAEKTISDKVDAVKVTADKAAADLVTEVNRAKVAEATLTNDVNAVEAKADKNTSDIEDLVENLTEVADTVSELALQMIGEKTEVNGIANDLATEVTRAKGAEKQNADGIAANATKIADLTTKVNANEAGVTKNTADINTLKNDLATEVSRATIKEGELESAINTGVAGAKAYADTQIADAVKDFATTEEVDNRIQGIIGTAPAALDTLGEIADVLNGNGDAIEAINGILSGKADKGASYTIEQSEAIHTATTTEINKIKDAVEVLKGDADTIGSVAHGVADAEHYTDDEIAKLRTEVIVDKADLVTKSDLNKALADVKVDVDLSDYAQKSEVTVIEDSEGNVINKLTIDNTDEDDTIEVYTKAQSDAKFALKGEVTGGGDVDLSGYATKTELNAKADADNVYTKDEVYTQEETRNNFVDKTELYGNYMTRGEAESTFCKIVTLTQAEYDALGTKDANTLYLVTE